MFDPLVFVIPFLFMQTWRSYLEYKQETKAELNGEP